VLFAPLSLQNAEHITAVCWQVEINRHGKGIEYPRHCRECCANNGYHMVELEVRFKIESIVRCSCNVACIFDVSARRASEFSGGGVFLLGCVRQCECALYGGLMDSCDTVSATARTKPIRAHFSARTERKCSARKWRKFLRFLQRTRLATWASGGYKFKNS